MKRSTQVMLLLMGTATVGGTAYTLMPREDCRADRPAITGPDGTQAQQDCARRSGSSSSSGGHGWSGRSWSYFDDSPSSSSPSSSSPHTTSSSGPAGDSGGGHVTRGGFGSFAHAISAHFSGG
ncbi:MAG: hypothetical protein AB1586_15165 [Pseudomonadota bacterium]